MKQKNGMPLAQAAAEDIIEMIRTNHMKPGDRLENDDAFHRYVRFLSQGGEKVFTELLQEAGLRSPFQEGALQTVAQESEALLSELERALSKETK